MKAILLKQLIEQMNLTDQTKFRLNEMTKFENYFNQEIKERELNSKRLSKYVAAFDYIDKVFIVLSATSSLVSIIALTTTVAGAPVGTASASFTLLFSLTTEIIKTLVSITRNTRNLTINWDGNKSWRIYYNFKLKR